MKKPWSQAFDMSTISPRLIMLLSFVGNSVANYLFGLLLSWLLLPGDFGLLAFAQTVLLIAGLILNSGFAWSTTAGIARSEGSQAEMLVRGSFVANLSLALVMGALILLLFALGPLQAGLETWGVAVSVAATLPFISLIAISSGAVLGVERFEELALIRLLEVGVKAVAGILLVVAGFGPTGAVAGFLVGSIVAATIGLWRTTRTLRMRLSGAIQWPSLRTAGGMFGALLGAALLLNLDIFSMKLLSGAARELTGYYQAAIILANTPYYLATALLAVLFPQLSRIGKLSLTGDAVGEMARLLLIFLLPIEFALALAPEAALGVVFPAAYVAGAPALRILALGNAAILFVALLSAAFQATGEARIPSVRLLTIAGLETIGLVLVVPVWRAIGAASLSLVASIAAWASLSVVYLQALDWRLTRTTATWLGKYAFAVGVGALTLLALYQVSNRFVLAVALSGLLYLASVLSLRLVRLPDLITKRVPGLQKPQSISVVGE